MSGDRHVDVILCGDVMTGRGIDQILPHPGNPRLHESYAKSALDYVYLAERTHGPVLRPCPAVYPWGDARRELSHDAESVAVINLETSVTVSDDYEPKGINYRMHPANFGCISGAGIDCCVLSNNHVLDWGMPGLLETLETLEGSGTGLAGAGRNAAEAARPWIRGLPGGQRVLVFGFGCPSSGIPQHWAATRDRPGVNLLTNLSPLAAGRVIDLVNRWRQPGDVVVASIHWGGNWGYEITAEETRFARSLADSGTVDIVHGHSSHHVKAAEIHNGRPILYGCGDFINDYEGIGGREDYRGDLAVMHVVRLALPEKRLEQLRLIVFQMRSFRLSHATDADVAWLRERLDDECRRFGCRVRRLDAHSLCVEERGRA